MKKILSIALFISLATTSVALAHGPRGHGKGPGHRFEELDADKSGAVSLDEMRGAAQRRFEKLDADKNGQVTREEMKAAMRARFEGRHGKRCHHEGDQATDGKPGNKPNKAAPKPKA